MPLRFGAHFSVVRTLNEFARGVAKSGKPAHRELIAQRRGDVAPFDPEAAIYAGQALALGACIVTGYLGEFRRVPSLPKSRSQRSAL